MAPFSAGECVRVTVDGELRPEVVLPPHESLTLEDLAPGRWRVSARWNGELLLPGSGQRELDVEGESCTVVQSLTAEVEASDYCDVLCGDSACATIPRQDHPSHPASAATHRS